MGGALMKRVSKTTNAIGDGTKLVLFKGSYILSISNDVWKQMARVYLLVFCFYAEGAPRGTSRNHGIPDPCRWCRGRGR